MSIKQNMERNEHIFKQAIDEEFATKAVIVLKAAIGKPSVNIFRTLISGGVLRPEVFEFIASAERIPEKHREAWMVAKEVAAGVALSAHTGSKIGRVLKVLQEKYIEKQPEVKVSPPDSTPSIGAGHHKDHRGKWSYTKS